MSEDFLRGLQWARAIAAEVVDNPYHALTGKDVSRDQASERIGYLQGCLDIVVALDNAIKQAKDSK